MNCDNLDCLARQEPETPCWEIAKRVEDYRSVSNTCRDCIVYLLKESVSFSSQHNIKDFISRRGLVQNVALGNQLVCFCFELLVAFGLVILFVCGLGIPNNVETVYWKRDNILLAKD